MRERFLAQRLPIQSYAAKTKDTGLLLDSTSGGAFTELARVVLADGGVVCGTGWDFEFNVVHKCIEDEEDIAELRGSKYVQSKLGGVYNQISGFLSEGRKVLFTGMPCQCAAMRLKFGADPNFVICGLMCYSNTPPYVWRKYLEELKSTVCSKISSIKFREKRSGWKDSRFTIAFENGKEISEPLYQNLYWKVFCSGFATYNACFNCRFRNGAHGADLIIGDFWGIEKIFPDIDYANGINAVLAYTEKGDDLLRRTALDMVETTYNDVLAGNPYLEKSVSVDVEKRNVFQKNFSRMTLQGVYHFSAFGPWYYRIPLGIYRRLRGLAGKFARRKGLR